MPETLDRDSNPKSEAVRFVSVNLPSRLTCRAASTHSGHGSGVRKPYTKTQVQKQAQMSRCRVLTHYVGLEPRSLPRL